MIQRKLQQIRLLLLRQLTSLRFFLLSNRLLPQNPQTVRRCRQLTIGLRPLQSFLNHHVVIAPLRIVQADQAKMLRGTTQRLHERLVRRMPQDFIVDAEGTANVVLLLKTLALHQPRIQTHRIRTPTGVDILKFLSRLHQSLLALL